MKRLFGHALKYGLLIALSFWCGWKLSRLFPEPRSAAATRAIREIPAGEHLSRPSPMDEPIWYQELLRVSEEEKEMEQVNTSHQSFVRGYW
jgi:hypothetical protein